MQRGKRDSIVRCGSAITMNGIVPFGGAVAAEVSCPLAMATTRQNMRYGKLRQVRAATARHAINFGFFMPPLLISYIIILLH